MFVRIASLFLSVFIAFARPALAYDIELNRQEISWIGEKIFANECSSRDNRLMQWNEGEDFLSLGIGHFIWYPKDKRGPFEESWPEFTVFAKTAGADIPSWLRKDPGQPCPWQTKQEFLKNREDKRAVELRGFLETTKPLQAEFIIKRFEDSLSLIASAAVSPEQQRKINRQIERLLATAQGTYAMIDYSNFKGMGMSVTERYNGEGWGLLQVLMEMQDEYIAPDAIREFSESADRVLTRRVNNAPTERNEQRWLNGWRSRLKTYF
ncbi:MAG: hypothetical protein D4S01_09275 [Dehalococcoidia bacterium]|nr:MAG: hypothetical protein D4S01_09275 [Dehalococcoidia bacterium]